MPPKIIDEYSHPETGGRELGHSQEPEGRGQSGNPSTPPSDSVATMRSAAKFLREYWARLLGISALVLVPCHWQSRIQAGDLASHVYNAWLAQLIAQGKAPGLYIATQWNNILFDLLLLHLGNIFGLPAAERIAVGMAVLIFFWGAFAFICAISKQTPWRILPCVAIFAYGWTFQMGFFNYYLSLGLAFIALAILYRAPRWQRALALPLVPLIWMAHPLGLLLLLGAGAYLLAADARPARQQYYCAAAAAVLLFLIRLYLIGHYTVSFPPSPFLFTGADQLMTYGAVYHTLAYVLLAFLAACLVLDVAALRREEASQQPILTSYRLVLQLYGLALLAAFLLPTIVYPSTADAPPVSFLTERCTSVSAILLCVLVALTKPQKWHLAGFAIFAAIFFGFTFRDTATVNRMEDQAEFYERVIPAGQRIVATIWPLRDSRVFIDHIVDRACIHQCFSYGNYEPSSRQFRIRAQAGNAFVTADAIVADQLHSGSYLIQPQDLPLYQIYQCDLTGAKLCMRELTAGEANGRIGLHRVTSPGR